jgi:2'-hydroxyisoflavone reductase
MKLCIVGGTRFLGKHIVLQALDAGHEITLVHRGKTNPDLFPDVETIHLDRNANLDALAGRSWDAVIDTCGYYPRQVRDLLAVIGSSIGLYVFISSVSVYADFAVAGITEEYPVGTLDDETSEEMSGATYGPLKALCEQAALDALPHNSLIIRPGLIVGPDDPTDRFTYWPVVFDQARQIIMPHCLSSTIQYIDVRDLAAWTLQAIAQNRTGCYNLTGPAEPLTWQQFEVALKELNPHHGSIHHISEAALQQHKVQPYADLPLWVPQVGDYVGFEKVSIQRALDAGLQLRPLTQTLADTLAWYRDTGRTVVDLKTGLSEERRGELESLVCATK